MSSWSGSGTGWWAPAPQLSVPRRPIGNVVRSAFSVYGRSFPQFLALAGGVYALGAIVLVPAYLAFADLMGPVYDQLPDPFAPTAAHVDAYIAALRGAQPAMFWLSALIAVAAGVLLPLAIAATVAATPEAASGNPVMPRAALRRLRQHLPALLGLIAVVAVLQTAPTMLTLLPQTLDPAAAFPIEGRLGPSLALSGLTSLVGLAVMILSPYLYVRWFVALPAVVVEGRGFRAGLARSAALTKGSRWYVLGVLVVLFIGQLLVTAAVIVVAVILGAALGASSASNQGIVGSFARASSFTSLVALVMLALYVPVYGLAMAILRGDLAWRADALAAAQAAAASPAMPVPPG